MKDVLIQPYGILVWGDLLGFLLALALPGFWPGARGRQRIWVFQCWLAAWGSLTVLPRALYRLDMPVFAYHLASLVLCLWLARLRFDDVASFAWAKTAYFRLRTHLRGDRSTLDLYVTPDGDELGDMPSWDRL